MPTDTLIHPDHAPNLMLINPQFPASAYWNWTEVCRAVDRKALGIPLGLITFASTLPDTWNVRLLDLNSSEWDEDAWQWADTVAVGGMIIQQRGMFDVINRGREDGKFVVVGGADATSQPQLYENADARVLGEAESIVPVWLEAWPSNSETSLTQDELDRIPFPVMILFSPTGAIERVYLGGPAMDESGEEETTHYDNIHNHNIEAR